MRVTDSRPGEIAESELWEHPPRLARIDGYSLAVTRTPIDRMLGELEALL
jgi:predicted transcriptional regulator